MSLLKVGGIDSEGLATPFSVSSHGGLDVSSAIKTHTIPSFKSVLAGNTRTITIDTPTPYRVFVRGLLGLNLSSWELRTASNSIGEIDFGSLTEKELILSSTGDSLLNDLKNTYIGFGTSDARYSEVIVPKTATTKLEITNTSEIDNEVEIHIAYFPWEVVGNDEGNKIIFGSIKEINNLITRFSQVNSPFRLIFQPTDGSVNSKWEVKVTHTIADDSGRNTEILIKDNEKLLESDGASITVGDGTDDLAYSDLCYPLGNAVVLKFINNSAESLSGNYYLVEYPFEVNTNIVDDSSDVPKLDSTTPLVTRYRATMAAGDETTKIAYDTSKKTLIEFLEFSSNDYPSPVLRIRVKNEDGSYQDSDISTSWAGAGGRVDMATIEANGFSLFDVIAHEDGDFKYALNRYMSFPFGVTIEIKNISESEVKFALSAYSILG